MTITTEGSEQFTMQCQLENPRHIVVIHRGREVGAVSARYDFSKLPAPFHAIVAGMCAQTNKLYYNAPISDEEAMADLRATRERLERLDARPWWKKLLMIGVD